MVLLFRLGVEQVLNMASFLRQIESHLGKVAASRVQTDGSSPGPMWPAVIDVHTGQCPGADHVPRRVYRLIGAPRGSTLYWDQPLVVAAYALSELTGIPRYARAVDAYIESFLAQCVAPTGMFQWGNHQYVDLFEQKTVSFSGGHHELRPITPAWELFWRQDPERTADYIRAMGRRHVYDPGTGGFNRHDDGRKGHAFLEAGGILAESLSWLYQKTADASLRDLALRIAQYSYRHRDMSTGLVANEPDTGRWDSKVTTTEVGLWAQCLLRAAGYTSNDEFIQMARDAVRAYLEHAYDDATGKYFGQVAVDSGTPVIPAETGYWPGRHADPWNTDQWPTHDYPMAMAEACLSLHALTREPVFLDAIRRWACAAVNGGPNGQADGRTRRAMADASTSWPGPDCSLAMNACSAPRRHWPMRRQTASMRTACSRGTPAHTFTNPSTARGTCSWGLCWLKRDRNPNCKALDSEKGAKRVGSDSWHPSGQ